ncbi:MAG: hypothetical protein ACRC10_03530 [Thermoguttaceae bacterium]
MSPPLDLTSDPGFSTNRAPLPIVSQLGGEKTNGDADQKKFVGVRFNCCGLYVRVYLNKAGTAYEGRCPKCAKPIRLKIGPGGTDNRFFEAY